MFQNSIIFMLIIALALTLGACGPATTPAAPPAPTEAVQPTAQADPEPEAEPEPVTGAEAAGLIAEIKAKLDHALEEYEEGETDEAYEIAASAYLEGFEYLEGGLLAKDRELVETLELDFKEYRDGIKAGKSKEELTAIIAEINDGLTKAEGLLK